MSEAKSNPKPNLNLIPGNTIKCGVFINKDHKIEQLSNKNIGLKRLIEEQMNKNKEFSLRLQQKRTRILSTQNQSNLLQIQDIKLTEQVNQFQKQIQQFQPLIDEKNKSVQSLTMQISQISEEYENTLKKDQNVKALLQRYKQQIRKEKIIYKSDTNAKKAYEEINKKLISYEKNIEILENKLQSKHKYLGIITKKIQKKQISKQKQKQLSSTRHQTHFKSHVSSSNKMIGKINQFSDEKQKPKRGNENMKDFNNLIRKKNQIQNKKG